MKSTFQTLLTLLVLFTISNCTTETNTSVTPNLSVRWKLEKNYELQGQSVHNAIFAITNNNSTELGSNWEMYWNQSPRGIISIDSSKHIDIQRINGDYYRMRPKKYFSLGPKETVVIKMTGQVWMIKEADGPVGIYLVSNPGDEETLHPLKDFKIEPFTNAEQVTRGKNDNEAIPTAEYLFDQNKKLKLLPGDQWYKSIPSPTYYKKTQGVFNIKNGLTLLTSESLIPAGKLFLESLQTLHGIKGTTTFDKADITVILDGTLPDSEGYQLSAGDGEIRITAKDKAGAFYGFQTLLNLIEKRGKETIIEACEIRDAPAYSYRGIHLDVTRNFQSKATILKMIDVMASYKVNKLVLCMTEDEGWRLEIDGLPELTQVGSKRGHPAKDGSNLEPAYGSGPLVNNPNGSGFYTRADFKDIIQYAHQRQVDVIPMINFPGHARAAIKAMEYRYNRLMKEGKEKEALQFRSD